MDKNIILIIGRYSSSKTGTIRSCYEHLTNKYGENLLYPSEYPTPNLERYNDFISIIDIKGIKIGFCSYGDSLKEMSEYVPIFVRKECDLIIGACRTTGQTLDFYTKYYKKEPIYNLFPFVTIPEDKEKRYRNLQNSRILNEVLNKISELYPKIKRG